LGADFRAVLNEVDELGITDEGVPPVEVIGFLNIFEGRLDFTP